MPYLDSPVDSFIFSLGLPSGLIEKMPPQEVGKWIAKKPDKRASAVARLITVELDSDETLASRLIGLYGDREKVNSAFFSAYISGGWAGPASLHWISLADRLVKVADRTSLQKLRRWAVKAERSLRNMAENEHAREQEEELQEH